MMKRMLNNSFLKSILTLSSGTIIGQIITFVAAPILTRLYSPEEIGLYTILITVVNMFGGVIVGRYDMAIVSEKEEENVYSLIKLSIWLSIFSSLIIGLFYSIYYTAANTQNIYFVLFFISVTLLLFLSGIELIITSYNNRMNQYKKISTGAIYQAFGKELTIILFGLVNPTSIGLTISQIIGKFLNIFKQATNLKYIQKRLKTIKFSNMKIVAKKYKNQLFFSTPALFANSFSYSSINLFIENLFGASVLGFYSISYRVLGIPLTLISNNVSKVYYREASIEFNSKGSYRKTLLKTTLLLTVVAIPVVMGLIILSPLVFGWFFGEEWSVAGSYVQILAPMFGIRLIVSPLTSGVIISKKQAYELTMQSVFIVISLVVFISVRMLNLPVEIYLRLISIGFSIVYIAYYILLFKLSE